MKDRSGSADLSENASASPRIALDLSDRGPDNGHHNPYQLQTVEASGAAASLSFPSLHKTHSDKHPTGQEDGIVPTKTARKQAKKSLFKNPGFPESEKSRAFRRRFYPEATKEDWSDWGWQVRNRIRDLEQLSRIIKLSSDEETAVLKHRGSLPIGITPYYASLLDELNPDQPLRRTHIPVTGEYVRTPGEDPDPLGEDHDTATPGLVHRYPDRVLFLTTGFC